MNANVFVRGIQMGDGNEQQILTGSRKESISPQYQPERPAPAPIWRFRPAAPPLSVVRAIKTQIIPRIAWAFRGTPNSKVAKPDLSPGELETFVALLQGQDEDAPAAFVELLLASGTQVDAIFLQWFTPAARRLGDMWEKDTTDFAMVTLAVGRMQRMMHQLGERFAKDGGRANGDSALLTTIPGEQHSFGLSMVAEFFRRAGWNLATGPFQSQRELTELVQERWFDIVGYSVSSDRKLDDLERSIRDVRRDSRNRRVAIILGGPILQARPELAAAVRADMVVGDVTAAPDQARTLVAAMKGQA
ncbi:methanogenic corrinoid protein MtbC1 [Rhodopseudomonas rhenobacensis]|uniref:Methanogenic corrinoid protein MtbC1 n=1 Tax=Rhodopseudomonas rhenobacensis TaxID=87461 RepID=A0A7W7Z8A7_9BRAD|nr:cobalamin B12-binding domain-containing protein [Rhodopseudomonas rhenobacensis]MBB5049723.1 methanogenic corrinoid protein MtbC1 [Rhodopseudomonas rhenobacensis]